MLPGTTICVVYRNNNKIERNLKLSLLSVQQNPVAAVSACSKAQLQ